MTVKNISQSPRHLALAQTYPSERHAEIARAFERGRQVGQTDHWMAGAKIGFICGCLVGLGAGCAGAIFWIGFAVRGLA